MAMSEGNPTPEERDPQETGPAQGDPTALPGVEAAMFGLATYCPVTFLGTKAVETICGDDRPDGISSTERVLRSNVRLGYGIALAGLFCPIFWLSYLAGVTGAELIMARGSLRAHRPRRPSARRVVPGPARQVPPGQGNDGRIIAYFFDREEDPLGSPAGFRRIPGRHPSQITAIR